MKRILFLVPFTLITVFGFSQLTLENHMQQGINLTSVFFTNTNKGYTVGNNGISLMTNDGGSTWIDSPNTVSCYLQSVFFINDNCGYAVVDGFILKTINSGENWSILSYTSNRNLTSVYFTDSLTGVAVGTEIDTENAIVLKTVDGGNTWYVTYQYSFSGSTRLFCIYFTDPDHGWALGYISNAEGPEGFLLRTFNGGETWSTTCPFGYNPLNSMSFPDPDTGYIVGGAGTDFNFTVYKTVNGGGGWDRMITGKFASLYSVFFTDVNHGVATSDSGHIYRTTDGGVTWSFYSIGVKAKLNSVYFPDDTTGYIVGNCGIILKTIDAGATWTILKDCGTVGITERTLQQSMFTVYPNPANDKIIIETTTLSALGNLSISNLDGQQLITHQITRSITQFDISGLPAGVYLVRLTSDKTVATGKFIKQ